MGSAAQQQFLRTQSQHTDTDSALHILHVKSSPQQQTLSISASLDLNICLAFWKKWERADNAILSVADNTKQSSLEYAIYNSIRWPERWIIPNKASIRYNRLNLVWWIPQFAHIQVYSYNAHPHSNVSPTCKYQFPSYHLTTKRPQPPISLYNQYNSQSPNFSLHDKLQNQLPSKQQRKDNPFSAKQANSFRTYFSRNLLIFSIHRSEALLHVCTVLLLFAATRPSQHAKSDPALPETISLDLKRHFDPHSAQFANEHQTHLRHDALLQGPLAHLALSALDPNSAAILTDLHDSAVAFRAQSAPQQSCLAIVDYSMYLYFPNKQYTTFNRLLVTLYFQPITTSPNHYNFNMRFINLCIQQLIHFKNNFYQFFYLFPFKCNISSFNLFLDVQTIETLTFIQKLLFFLFKRQRFKAPFSTLSIKQNKHSK
ncbi:hypothetical protein SS50377_24300 [Spironucleus salmonicida]|uniref:Uncharacterized protein n=1 Tax=Spironucleus salmonicida TaxID=348837 RepID=A0A9P8LU09_9EUKA|nr:hypothetical protein SS50377_24300 [Spironucleus salmonicida]